VTLALKLEWFQGNRNLVEMKPLSFLSKCLAYMHMNNNTELNLSDLCVCLCVFVCVCVYVCVDVCVGRH
jgi:hypothetical protein